MAVYVLRQLCAWLISPMLPIDVFVQRKKEFGVRSVYFLREFLKNLSLKIYVCFLSKNIA